MISPSLQAALEVVAWALVVLLLTGGYWFLQKNQMLHTALMVLLLLAAVFVLIRIKELILMIAIAGVMAFILDGWVDRIAVRVQRPLAIAIVYAGVAAFLVLVGTLVIPRVVRQAHLFIVELPRYVTQGKEISGRVTAWYGGAPEQVQNAIDSGMAQLETASKSVTRQIEHVLLEVLGWTVKSILILVMSIYLIADKDLLRRQFTEVFPTPMRPEVQETIGELSLTFSRYLRGQLTVILFIAVSVTVVLTVFSIPYPTFIGFMAGLLEVIPYFGAVAGAVPAVALGFLKSTWIGVTLIVFFVALNQIEGHVIIPLVMGHHLEMRPLTILLSLIAGEMLWGIVGMIVAVPAVAMARVLIPHVTKYIRYLRRREWQTKQAAPTLREVRDASSVSATPPAPS